jgi:hypothetical protein
MNLTRNRIQSIGWAFVLTICMALTVALTLRVNAVKGQVRQTESKIVSLQRDIQFLGVEFQTRANQQQLAALNSVEFGYVAPGAGQYIEGERQLASYGMPRGPGAPKPIRMAHAAPEPEAMEFVAMVSPLSGKPLPAPEKAKTDASSSARNAATAKGADLIGGAISDAALGARLARIDTAGYTAD